MFLQRETGEVSVSRGKENMCMYPSSGKTLSLKNGLTLDTRRKTSIGRHLEVGVKRKSAPGKCCHDPLESSPLFLCF